MSIDLAGGTNAQVPQTPRQQGHLQRSSGVSLGTESGRSPSQRWHPQPAPAEIEVDGAGFNDGSPRTQPQPKAA